MARYTEEEQLEFREVENSRIHALFFLIERNNRMAAPRRKESSPDVDYELAVRRALFFLRSAKEFQSRGEKVLTQRPFRHALKEALRRDDLGFLVSVGRVLSREQKNIADLADRSHSCSPLEAFLINYWCEQVDQDTAPLCFLSMKELCETCRTYLPSNQGLYDKLINNTWRNLGLKRVKGFKFKGPGLRRLKVSVVVGYS